MNGKALAAQTRKLADISRFAFGKPVHVSVDLNCDVYTGYQEAETRFEVYIASPLTDSHRAVIFTSSNWKDVLALITWLEDIEAVTSFRSR